MRMRPRPAQPHGSASFGQRVRRANKALLAAVGAGIITLVTSAVVALPHWIAGQISDPHHPSQQPAKSTAEMLAYST
jgi:hypothetical protein